MTEKFNWDKLALDSEIAFSVANGGYAVRYDNFIHIYNPHVPWGGDFNRTVGIRLSDFESFEKVAARIQEIHTSKGLEPVDRFDIVPPSLDPSIWSPYLEERGYCMHEAIFFSSPVSDTRLPEGFKLYSPTANEYIQWYKDIFADCDFFTEEYFQKLKPLHLGFVKTFRPFWLIENEKTIGSIYIAKLGNYSRLFGVEIKEEFQGRGHGRILLDAVKGIGATQGVGHILLQTQEDLRGFYEKCGFTECSRNTIIRLK